jgi:hypothetical protein
MNRHALTAMIVIVLLTCARVLFAESEDVSALIDAGPGAQIDENVWSGPPVNADRFPKWISALGGSPTYDMRKILRAHRINLRPQGLAIYAADTGLLYVRSSADDVLLTQLVFERPDETAIKYLMELDVRRKDQAAGDGTLLAHYSMTIPNGVISEISAHDPSVSKQKELKFRASAHYETGWPVDIEIFGELPIPGEAIRLVSQCEAFPGGQIVLYERAKTDLERGIAVTLKLSPPPGEVAEKTKWRLGKIAEIEKELKSEGNK